MHQWLSQAGFVPVFLWRNILVWQELFSALALVLIIEGILPFLSPNGFKQSMLCLSQMPDKNLRMVGLMAMLAGVILLYLSRA